MTLKWYGYRDLLALGITPPKADTNFRDFTMDFVNIHDGDTIRRFLFGWYAESVVEGDASGLQQMMVPGFVHLGYSPEPDGEGTGSAQAPGGSGIWRETLNWQQRLYTNGTDYGVKYWAGSNGMRSSNVSRTIEDKTVANVRLSVSLRNSGPNIDGVTFIEPDVNVMLWTEILVEHH